MYIQNAFTLWKKFETQVSNRKEISSTTCTMATHVWCFYMVCSNNCASTLPIHRIFNISIKFSKYISILKININARAHKEQEQPRRLPLSHRHRHHLSDELELGRRLMDGRRALLYRRHLLTCQHLLIEILFRLR